MNNREAKERIKSLLSYMESLDADEEEEKDIEALRMAIEALEQTEWIPLSSGNYPKEDQECLFWDEILGLGYGSYFITSRGIKCFWDDARGSDAKNVIAWMPLPEPYKEEEK